MADPNGEPCERARPRPAATGRRLLRLLAFLAAWTLLGAVAVAAPDGFHRPGVYDPAGGWPGRFERIFADRRARLAAAAPRDPAAVLPVLGAVDQLLGEIGTERIDRWLGEVAASRRVHPLVASFAARERARLAEQVADARAAAAALRSQGYVLDWLYVGPFDYTGPKDLDGDHPCRAEPFAADATFTGAVPREPLTWRAYDYDGAPDGGFVGFDDYLAPNEKVFACATTWVHLARGGDVAVRVGTGGAYRVFVGAYEVLRGDERRLPHPLQDVGAARLSAGWHRLTVLVANESEPWGFYLRLSTPQGRPIPGIAVRTRPPEGGAQGTAGPARTRPASLRNLLERRAERSKDPRREVDLAEFEWRTHPYARSDTRTLDRLRRLEPTLGDFRTSVLRAHVETDEAARRLVLERAVALGEAAGAGPRLGPLFLELAFREQALGLVRSARAFLRRAFEVAPDDVAVELTVIDELEAAGFEQQAVAASLDLLERRPDSAMVREAVAARLAAAGRKDEAMEILEAGRVTTAVGRARLLNLALEAGRTDRAVALLSARAAAEPARPDVFRRLAWVLDSAGDERGAWEAMARALQLAPLSPDLHAEAARMALLHGRTPAAVAELRRSLDLKPQQPDLRDLLAALDRSADRDLFARMGLSLEEVAALEVPQAWRGRPTVVLARRIAVVVHDNGLSERLDHRIVRIQDERGARDGAVYSTFYDPSQSYVEVRRARVRHPDGSIEDLGRVREVSLAEAGYRMYYDRRRVDAIFDRLEPGDVVEVAFVARDVAARNMFDTYFGDLQPIEGLDPILRYEYVVEAPDRLPLFFNRRDVEVEKLEGRVRYRVVRSKVPHIDPEPHMPGWTDVASYVHVSSYETWDAVAEWYWDLVRDQLIVDDRIRQAVAEAVRGIDEDDLEARMEAVYAYVVRNTRYVGLEFGIHGYKPYPTTEVFARRFGDCKDKASLLKVMLAELGIDSHLVLVRTRDLGGLGGQPASLAAFNHAIVYVPRFRRYLDGTAEWAGPRELPAQDQGAVVLHVLDGKGGRLTTIPVSSADHNLTRIEGTLRLDAQGTGDLRLSLHVEGTEAALLRRAFHAKEQRRERAAAVLGDLYGSVDVREVSAAGVDGVLAPVDLAVSATVPGIAAASGGALRLPVLGHRLRQARVWAPKARRRHPLEIGVPTTVERRFEVRAPKGFRFAVVPQGGRVVHDAVEASLEVSLDAGGTRARVTSRIRYLRPRIAPAAFPGFRKALQRIDTLFGQSFTLERAR